MEQGNITKLAEQKWQELLESTQSAKEIKNLLLFLQENPLDKMTVENLWEIASGLKRRCWSITNAVSYWNLVANDAYAFKKAWSASEHFRLTKEVDKTLKMNAYQAKDFVEEKAYPIISDEIQARYIADQFDNLYKEANSYIMLIQSMVNTKKFERNQTSEK